MSGNNYGYYYNHQNVQNFQRNQYQDRSQWSVEQDQYNRNHSPAASYKPTTSIKNEQPHTPKNQNYFNNNNYFFHHPPPPIRNRYPNQFINPVSTINTWSQPPPPQALQRNFPNRRKRTDSDNYDNKIKTARKKKKPLSQAVPSKKIWTIEEAEKALTVEKEYNKLIKNHSLIIKFPDLELDRDIVSNFHPNIESVHFQQPSTPRFCFITLKENTDADAVIGELSKIKFGDGHLKVEYKKKSDEEHQNITASDIDPTTLYVGNLAQEITKEDMVKAFPECRRIDIGYAKKMKFTRYAFVSFKTIEDSIAAFKRTHSTQMYSKSLIVRFRRLHGTVGMPGETKTPHIQQQQQQQQQLLQQKQQQQQQQQQQPQQRQQQELQPQLEPNVDNTENTENAENTMTDMENQNDKLSNHKDDIDLNIVKQEICSDEEDDDYIRSRIQTHMMCFGSENIYDVDCSPSDTIPRAINHNLSSGFQFDTIIPKLFATVKQEKLDDYNNENEVSSSVDKQLVQPVSESPTSSTKDDKQDSNKQSTSNDKKQPDIEIEKTLNSIKQEKEDYDDDDDDDDYDDDDEGYGFPVIDFREQLRNLEYNSTM